MGLVSTHEFFYGKRKLSQFHSKLNQKQNQVQGKVADTLDVIPEGFECTHQSVIVKKRVQQNSDDWDKLVQMMKEKMQHSPCKIKSKVLMLTPLSWTV